MAKIRLNFIVESSILILLSYTREYISGFFLVPYSREQL